MKIKILSSAMKTFWYSDRIGDELYVDYNIESVGNPFIYTKNHHYIRSCDSVITELPKSFCVKRCHDDKEKWEKYIQWLSNKYVRDLDGFINKYYGVRDNYTFGKDVIFGTEIHIDDMIKHIDYMERHIKGGEQFHKESQLTVKMETQRISREGLKEIYSVACDEWQGKLKSFGYRNPLENYIDLTKEEVNEMFFASNDKQKSILSKYLKKEDDGSVDVSGCNISTNKIIDIRGSGEYENKSFWLSEIYNWEMKKDSIGKLCLIPTKKK